MRVRASLVADIGQLVAGLRSADKKEARLLGVNPERSLEESLQGPQETWTVEDPQGPFCMFGVADDPYTEGLGVIWLLSTNRIMQYKRELLRLTPVWLDYMAAPYVAVHNVIHESNRVHLRWVRWAGFETTKLPVTQEGLQFIQAIHHVQSWSDSGCNVCIVDAAGQAANAS